MTSGDQARESTMTPDDDGNPREAKLQQELDKLKWSSFQAEKYKQAKERAEELLVQEKRADAELEEMRDQHRELLGTIQLQAAECNSNEGEFERLRRREAELEEQLYMASQQNAQLGSHANHKQKINYLKKLKDESNRLVDELKHAKARAKQLEAQLRGGHAFEDFLGAGGPGLHESFAVQSLRGASSAALRRRSPSGGRRDEESNHSLALRRSHQQARAAERAVVDCEHLRSLVQQALPPEEEETSAAARLRHLRELAERPPRAAADGQASDASPH